MRSLALATLFGALAFSTPLLVTSDARADIGVCGALASSSCSFVTGGGCDTQCTPVNMTVSCGATCNQTCTETPSTTCATTCETSCKTSCTPGQTHCATFCEDDCKASCSGYCTDDTCTGECEGSCQGQCATACVQDPPDCDTLCQTGCETSCQVKENLKCYVSCDDTCTTSLTGGCKTDCEAPYGALFCDGQYVKLDDYNDCAASFNVSGSVSAKCSAAEPGVAGGPFGVAALAAFAAGIGLIASRRRNRK
jgi:hypothetical protein